MFLVYHFLLQSKYVPPSVIFLSITTVFRGEFADAFSRYGVVSHCVILATVDNSSRRRGFVVMSSHEEAKSAMVHLSRTQIKYVPGSTEILSNTYTSEAILSTYHGLLFSGPKVRVHTVFASLP
jgi:hypothetical protein